MTIEDPRRLIASNGRVPRASAPSPSDRANHHVLSSQGDTMDVDMDKSQSPSGSASPMRALQEHFESMQIGQKSPSEPVHEMDAQQSMNHALQLRQALAAVPERVSRSITKSVRFVDNDVTRNIALDSRIRSSSRTEHRVDVQEKREVVKQEKHRSHFAPYTKRSSISPEQRLRTTQ
jgi:hypothetical protein